MRGKRGTGEVEMEVGRVSGLECELKIVMPEWKWWGWRLPGLARKRKRNQMRVVFDPNEGWNRT
jgi:hypothetical protein